MIKAKLCLLASFCALLRGEKFLGNMGNNTTLRDHNITKKLSESARIINIQTIFIYGYYSLFVVSDGELQMPGNNTVFLVVACSVSSQFENFSSKVFQNSSEINYKAILVSWAHSNKNFPLTRSASTNTLSIISLLQQTVYTADGKLETGF